MKIVIVARESGTSTGRYVDKLVEYIHKAKPRHKIIILTKPNRIGFFKSIAPSFEVIGTPYKEFGFGEQLGLALQLYRLKPDLTHFTMTQQPILYFRKTITTIQDLTTLRFYNPDKNWLIFKLKRFIYAGVIIWVAHKSKLILTPSNFVKKDLSKFAKINRNKITVTYDAADPIKQSAQKYSGLDAKQFLLYVGRPAPHKNLNRLVDALGILKSNYPNLLLVLAGKNDKNYELLKKYVSTKNLTSQVMFTDFVPENQLRWLYENTSAYVFPSLSEGFGLPPLEAMCHDAPIISSKETCLPEIYEDAALYFDPLDVSDIATKIAIVLENKKIAQELINNGSKQVKKYSWSKTASQTLSAYDSLLEG